MKTPLIDSGVIAGVNPAAMNVRETFTIDVLRNGRHMARSSVTNATGGASIFDKPVGHVVMGLPTQAPIDALVSALHGAGWPATPTTQALCCGGVRVRVEALFPWFGQRSTPAGGWAKIAGTAGTAVEAEIDPSGDVTSSSSAASTPSGLIACCIAAADRKSTRLNSSHVD